MKPQTEDEIIAALTNPEWECTRNTECPYGHWIEQGTKQFYGTCYTLKDDESIDHKCSYLQTKTYLCPLGITSLIKRCSASPMTVRAYVEKMTKEGKLIRDPVTKKYSINDQYQGA